MSLKQEIETWVQALAHYDNNEYEEALKVFDNIADTSKILFNCGVIHATLGEHDKAVECYQRAVRLDQYLAVSYFQQGVSNFLVGDFEEALANFNDTLLYLRGNTYIDYAQLGLKFRLYSCEVLFNRGLCYIYLQQMGPGMQDFEYAVKEKVTPDHDVIDEAIRERAENYTVFSIPVGVVYRPNEAKVKNLKTKDYLGKARLVAASDKANAFTGFQGSEMKKTLNLSIEAKDDRPEENISYAATNLVQKNLSSRSRQQSEPPMSRNMFPPTPPPESDKPTSFAGSGSGNGSGMNGMTGRAASVRNRDGPRMAPQRMETDPYAGRMGGRQNDMGGARGMDMAPSNGQSAGPAAMRANMSPPMDRPRLGTMRTASEPRGPPNRQWSQRGTGMNKPPLFRETTPQRPFEPVQEDPDYDDVYDMYQSPRVSRGMRRTGSRMNRQQQYGNEDDEYFNDAYEDDSVGEEDFEMMGGQAPPPLRTQRGPSTMRSGSRRPEIHKIRVKVHADDDTRYMIIGPAVDYIDFEGRIRDKFGFKSRLRIKMQDDGDMITMGDQDDLDMLISSAKQMARKEKSDMGKMEVWVQEGR